MCVSSVMLDTAHNYPCSVSTVPKEGQAWQEVQKKVWKAQLFESFLLSFPSSSQGTKIFQDERKFGMISRDKKKTPWCRNLWLLARMSTMGTGDFELLKGRSLRGEGTFLWYSVRSGQQEQEMSFYILSLAAGLWKGKTFQVFCLRPDWVIFGQGGALLQGQFWQTLMLLCHRWKSHFCRQRTAKRVK
jgi:hypothetical protein